MPRSGRCKLKERSVGRAAATGAGVATGAFRGLPCTSPIRCRRPSKSPCGRRVGTPLERGVARRAPDRRGNRGARGEETGVTERAGATALDATRRRSRIGLVASGRDGCDTQEDIARGRARNRRTDRRRLHRDDPALARRGPHRAEAENEWSWQAPLDDTRGYLVADPWVGATNARSANRASAQSRRQADRTRQRLDRTARALIPLPPRHSGLS